jgi:hypothetical protein
LVALHKTALELPQRRVDCEIECDKKINCVHFNGG